MDKSPFYLHEGWLLDGECVYVRSNVWMIFGCLGIAVSFCEYFWGLLQLEECTSYIGWVSCVSVVLLGGDILWIGRVDGFSLGVNLCLAFRPFLFLFGFCLVKLSSAILMIYNSVLHLISVHSLTRFLGRLKLEL